MAGETRVSKWGLKGKKPHNKWSSEEDKLLIKIVSFEGQRWNHISRIFNNGRTGSDLHQRWNSVLDPRLNFDPLTIEEEKKILIY